MVCAPELVRRVTFDSQVQPGEVPEPARLLRVARSFCHWLVVAGAAAGHVRELDMLLGTSRNGSSPDSAAFFAEVESALTACGPGLRRVRLHLQFFPHVRWHAGLAAALPHVTVLWVCVEEGSVSLEAPLASMQQLQELRLEGSPGSFPGKALEIPSTISLPPSLTKLHRDGLGHGQREHDALPPQVKVAAGLPTASTLPCMCAAQPALVS